MTDYFGRLPRNSSRGICVLKKSKRFIPSDNNDDDEEEEKNVYFGEKWGEAAESSEQFFPNDKYDYDEDGEKMLFGEKWSEAAGAEPLIVWPPIRS